MYLEIILNLPINQGFTYSYIPPKDEKPELAPAIGKRAEIMFGNKKTEGFIIGISSELPKNLGFDPAKIRPIKRIIDKEALFGDELVEIANWISRYYLCTLGEAVFSMIPSGRRESSAGGFGFEEEVSESKKNVLSDEQEKCVNDILNQIHGLPRFARKDEERSAAIHSLPLYHYIYGPTGSGKTEVFLTLAERILEQDKGVIYLVPEIGLTGQVVEAVTKRFGKTAAVLHSGLTPSQRLKEWNRIMHKEARVVIGARSAVFAPVPELGLIIIDEEHDSSYKSGNNPRYHARQVAMHRCSNLKIPLVMGSATPSIEAWYGMQTKSIVRHQLTKRLSGGEMPHIWPVNLRNYKIEGAISPPLEEKINEVLKNGHQAILFLNRRGFTHYFSCNSCGYELVCKNCSVPLTYHKAENRLKCHYCGWSITTPDSCPQCGSVDIGSTGFGTEYIEAETKAKFPSARIVRVDTDILKNKEQLLTTLDDFRNGKYDIMLGTQMVAKGLNFPKLELVGVILADAGLHMPDFRAGERTFSLITQVAGRAGRYFPDGKVIVQTYSPELEPVLYACQNKVKEYYEFEIEQRHFMDFPPFSRLLRMVFRSYNRKEAYDTARDAERILKEKNTKGVEILGPAECPLEKINSSWRYQILLKSRSIVPLQAMARSLLMDYSHSQNVYIEYDVDPVSLL